MVSHIRQYFRIRRNIWRRLHQVHPHPVSRHIQNQLLKRSNLPIISMAIVWGGVIFALLMTSYAWWGIWTVSILPLLLMTWSSIYITPWLYRIFEIVKGQYTANVIDTLGVIPEGKTFVILAICHAVMNRSDQLQWLRIMRLLIGGIIFSSLLMAVMIVFLQLPSVDIFSIFSIFFDIFLLIALIWFEHQQSVLLAYYLPVLLTEKLVASGEMLTVSAVVFFLIQFLTGITPLLFVIFSRGTLLETSFLSYTLLIYLCLHEAVLLIFFKFDDTLYDV